MRFWLRECRDKHLDCRAPNPEFSPTRLIDVGPPDGHGPIHLSLRREAKQVYQYCTLSHRWPLKGDILKLKLGNLQKLTKEIIFERLPKKFQDAITLTRRLGLRYLWIDSLCIIQDSTDDWTNEASSMADVYENSVCTLAVAGEVNIGTGDVFQTQNPLIHNWCKIAGTVDNGIFVTAFCSKGLEATLSSSLIEHTALHSRGWIFQERLLSPRMLYFGGREVLWACRQGRASEDNPNGPAAEPIFGPLVSEKKWTPNGHGGDGQTSFRKLVQGTEESLSHEGPLDRHSLWYNVVEEYSKCDLTNEEDKLIALSGVAQRVQKLTGWRYLAGLWDETLFSDLLWNLDGDAKGRKRSYVAPTWSWAAVDGQITSRHSTGARNWERLIEIKSVDTEPHPLDKAGTGQVFSGVLTITGALMKVTDQVSIVPPYNRQNFGGPNEMGILSTSERGLARPWATGVGHVCIGTLYLDVAPVEFADLFFLPFHGDLFHSSSPHHLVGLVLVQNARFYERVGLFRIGIARPEELPRGWRVLGERQIIAII